MLKAFGGNEGPIRGLSDSGMVEENDLSPEATAQPHDPMILPHPAQIICEFSSSSAVTNLRPGRRGYLLASVFCLFVLQLVCFNHCVMMF